MINILIDIVSCNTCLASSGPLKSRTMCGYFGICVRACTYMCDICARVYLYLCYLCARVPMCMLFVCA